MDVVPQQVPIRFVLDKGFNFYLEGCSRELTPSYDNIGQ